MKKIFSIITSLTFLFSLFLNQVTAISWTIEYSPSTTTNTDVIATITGFDEAGTVITNNGGLTSYTFANNGTFDFEVSGSVTTGLATANVNRIDKTSPTAIIEYSHTGTTNQDVIATITGFSETIINLNATGTTFASNGTFTFTYQDLAGNFGITIAEVTGIDKTIPTASIEYSPINPTNGNVTATLTGFSETLTGFNTTGYTFTSNGSFTFTYQDFAGNTGETIANVNRIDTTAPTTTIEYTPNGPLRTNGNVIATLTGFSKPLTLINATGYTFTSNGTFVFTYQDLLGNTGSNTANVNRIDTTTPTVGQAYIAAGMTGVNGLTGYYNGIIEIRALINDLGGANIDPISCEYTLNNGSTRNSATYNTTYCSASGLNPASNIQIGFRIKDNANNNATGAIKTYIFDDTAPTTTATPSTGTSNTTILVTLNRTDGGIGTYSGTRYCIDTTNTCTPNIAATTATITGATNALEIKFLRYRSIDRLNNIEITKSNNYTIDKVTPLITGINSYSNNITNSGYAKTNDTITLLFSSTRALATLPTITISGGSLSSATVTALGGNNYSASYIAKITDIQGPMKFLVNLQDTMGNIGTSTIDTVILDRTLPAGIAFIAPTAGTFRTSGQNYDIKRTTGSEVNFGPTSIKIIYSINSFVGYSDLENGTGNSGIYKRENFNLNTNNLQVRIIATDLAGNTTTITSAVFGTDNVAPVAPTFISPIGGEFLKGGSGYLVTWTGGYDPNNNLASIQLEYSLNNGLTYTNISNTITTNSTSYLWTPVATNYSTAKLRITYKDYAGLFDIRQTPSVFTIDSLVPNIANVISGKIYTGSITPTISDTNYSGSTITNGSITSAYVSGTVISQNGRYTLNAYDKAGNWTGRYFAIDTTAPTIQIYTGTIYKNTGFVAIATGIDATAGISGYQRTKLSGTGTITFSAPTANQTNITASTGGTYVIQVKATDKANWSGFATFTLIRDTKAPTLWSGSVSTSNQTATFSFFSNKTGSLIYSGTCGNGNATTATNSGATTTSWTLANATYSNCSVKVTDIAGNYSRINVPSFTINYTAPTPPSTGGPQGGPQGGPSNTPTCQTTDLICQNGFYQKKSGVSCVGGNLGNSCTIQTSTGLTINASGTKITMPELEQSYYYAKNLGITNASKYEYANMNGIVFRSHLAKMMSEFAIKVLKKKPDTSKKCEFNDISKEPTDIQKYIKTACQLGVMGVDSTGKPLDNFYPERIITRAVFGTTLSRTLRGNKFENTNLDWYKKHLIELKNKNIITDISKPENRELRGYVLLMLMRTDYNIINPKTTTTGTVITDTIISTQNSDSSSSGGSSTTTTPPTTSTIPTPTIPQTTPTVSTPTPTTPTTTPKWTETEQNFINNINKNYQFSVGFKKNASDVSIKYLQYFLKSKGFYQGTLNGTNSESTVQALFNRQKANNILTDSSDPAAGYLGPKTREIINPQLRTLLLNP